MSPETVKSKLPTRKWIAAQVTAVGAWLVAAIEAGWDINTSLQILAVGIVIEAVTTYVVANENTPGGVPRAAA